MYRPRGVLFLAERGVCYTYSHQHNVQLSAHTQFMDKLIQYLKDSRAELAHVSWPTQKQAVTYTIVVVVMSVAVSLFLGLADYIFTGMTHFFISK